MGGVKAVNLGVRFVLELCVLAAFGYWGWQSAEGGWRWLWVVLLPVAGATVWGRWVAPKASRRLSDPSRLGVEIVLFGAAVLALVTAGRPELGLILAALLMVNTALAVVWDQR